MRVGTIVVAAALIVTGGSACNPGSKPCEDRLTREDCEADPECFALMGVGIHRQADGTWAPDPGDCRFIECNPPSDIGAPAAPVHASPPEDPAQCYGTTGIVGARPDGWGPCAVEQRVPFDLNACHP